MAGSPLKLSDPLYDWDQSAADETVYFDELHKRVIHQQKGGFFAIDLADEGSVPDGVFVKFEGKEEGQSLRLVRFSPDTSHFAFLCGPRKMGVMKTGQPTKEPISLPFKWTKADLEVLGFFWLVQPAPARTDFGDLAVVTTQGIELFRVTFDQPAAKSIKAFPVAVRICWVDPVAGMVLSCSGPHTLQPFDLRAKTPQKMPKFDLVLGKNKVIECPDLSVMTIYDATYCIHADSTNGRVSLRNISSPAQGTPEHDIVIDVVDDDKASGTLRLSLVDNLLIVHVIESAVATVFDIRHREKIVVPAICGPSAVSRRNGDGEDASWSGWAYVGGSMIMDKTSGWVCRLQVDMDVVLQELLARTPHDLATIMRLLLRRSRCREHIVQTLKRALHATTSFNDLAQGFAVLNQAYRQTIEALSQKVPQGRQATVSLNQLETAIGQQSILSEKDMVCHVFYPHFLEITGGEAIAPAPGTEVPTPQQVAQDAWRIPLPALDTTNDGGGSRPVRSPYIVSVVINYLRSLLSMQILPHKILQCFVFDVCMYFHQEHTLQQLLHYHVLLDSAEMVLRLQEVATRGRNAWATQACLDMALRIPEHTVVADMLLHTKQYLDVVPFLINQQVTGFQLSRLFEQITGDADARTEDPDLMDHVLSEIRMWSQEAQSDAAQLAPPNLQDCGRWLPELVPP